MKRKFGMIAAVVLSSALTGTYADTITWTNTAGGSFQTAANWSPTNRIPGGLDTAQFNASYAGNYTVTLDDHVSVTNVAFPSGQFGLTLDLNGYGLTSASNGTVVLGSSVGSAIDLTVKSSMPGGKFNLYHMNFYSSAANAGGLVNITGSNTCVNVTVGAIKENSVFNLTTNSTFTVSDGAHLTASWHTLYALGTAGWGNGVATASPRATMIITDPGTTFTNGLTVFLGKEGTNMPTLVVTNGAKCKAGGLSIGTGGDTWYSYSPKANGKLVVTGTNSYCETSSMAMSSLAGEYGTAGSTAGGYAVVEKGGALRSLGAIYLSGGLIHYYPANNLNPGSVTNLDAYGEIVVRNPGSQLSVGTTLQITTVAKGACYVLDGATLTSGASSSLILSYGFVAASVTGTTTNQTAYTNVNAYGLFVVSNANSSANFNNVRFGPYGSYGDVIVADNARLNVTNGSGGYITLTSRSKLTVSDAFVETKTLTTVSNSTVRIELGARDHADAYIKTTTLAALNADATLEVGVLDGATLTPGDTVTLLTYTGTRTGTFKNLPEGSAFFVGGYRFRIYYGDGSNDAVTLKYLPLGTMIRVR